MKVKILSLLLSVTLFFFAAVPARAADGETFDVLNVLDYSMPNGGDKVNVGLPVGTNDISFSIPTNTRIYDVDMLLVLSGTFTGISLVTSSGVEYALTYYKVSDYLYRVQGYCDGVRSENFKLRFTHSTYLTVDFYAFSIFTWTRLVYNETGTVKLETYQYSSTINYDVNDTVNGRTWTGVSDYTDLWGSASATVSDWYFYDYIDMQFTLSCSDINSIAVVMGGQTVPFTSSIVGSPSWVLNDYVITVRVDLRGLDRVNSDGIPTVLIEFTCSPDNTNQFHVGSMVGILQTDTVDPLVFWLRKVRISIDSGVDRIVDAILGDTASGDSFQDDVKEEIDELDQAADIMDSVSRPDIDSIDVSMDQYASAADLSVLTAPVSVFFEIDLFKSILIMSILFATVSFVLFGKR